MIVTRWIDIDASPEEIWPYMVEPEKILLWCTSFQKFEYTGNKQSGVGTPLYIEEQAVGPLMKIYFSMTDWIENELIAFKKISSGGPKVYEQRWRIEPTDSGVKFTFWEEIQMPFGVIGKLLAVFGQRMSEATVEQMLDILKSQVEGEKVKVAGAAA
jgi:uncharacterized protein YndB with AHSA1/START domain